MENLNSSQIKQIRCQMGWSQAEMARCLGCETELIRAWEVGAVHPDLWQNSVLERFQSQAESLSRMTQLQPVVESILEQQSLEQIHQTQVVESLAQGHLAHFNFKF